MKTMIHISDLHFGDVDEEVLQELGRTISQMNPNVLVVSGDLTQRARTSQFRSFQNFIEQFPYPKIIVPGNHDIPLYNLFRRFSDPYGSFKKYAEKDDFPVYEDAELFVIGVRTPRVWRSIEGTLDKRQIKNIQQKLELVDVSKTKVMVCHHPVLDLGIKKDVGKRRLDSLESRIDVVLSGHLHHSESIVLPVKLGSTLLIQAGTASSKRKRNELNSFNEIVISPNHILVHVFIWNEKDKKFLVQTSKQFTHKDSEWIALSR